MVCIRNFCEKRQIWVSKPHFGEVRGDARPWLMTRWKAHGRLSIRVIQTLFRYLLRFRSYEAKCAHLGCFHRKVDLCAQILSGQDRPHQPLLASENQRHWVTRQ